MTTPSAPEFSHLLRANEFGDGTRERAVTATEEERRALARRFGLRALTKLEAKMHVTAEASGCLVTGTLVADLVQACVATDEDVRARIRTPFAIRFVRGLDDVEGDEIVLSDEAYELLPLEDERIDLGETVAQTLAINLDPYPRIPDAEEKLRALGVLSEGEAGPFAVLKGLKLGPKSEG